MIPLSKLAGLIKFAKVKDPKNLKEGVKLFETLLGSSFEIEKIESLNYS